MFSMFKGIQKTKISFSNKYSLSHMSPIEQHLDEIFTYNVEKILPPNSVSMKMIQNTNFICSHRECTHSYPLEQIHQHELYECRQRIVKCPVPYCQFIHNIETVISHSINCPFHLIYCSGCNTMSNVAVLTHDCKVIISQRSIPSQIKYYYENPPLNHSNEDVFLEIH